MGYKKQSVFRNLLPSMIFFFASSKPSQRTGFTFGSMLTSTSQIWRPSKTERHLIITALREYEKITFLLISFFILNIKSSVYVRRAPGGILMARKSTEDRLTLNRRSIWEQAKTSEKKAILSIVFAMGGLALLKIL